MKVVTSATVFNDAVGSRISITYSEVDEATGKIISDNVRTDRVLTAKDAKSKATALLNLAQGYIDELEA